MKKNQLLEAFIVELEKPGKNVRFRRLLQICETCFGKPRIEGSHHIYKMSWPGDPRINLQEEQSNAKLYQVQQVLKALRKLRARDDA